VAFLDQGVQRFSYALLPHAHDWRDAGTARRAAELNQPPVAVIDTFHRGSMSPAGSFIDVDAPGIDVTALKLAEDGSGETIVRCYETAGRSTRGTIRVGFLDQVFEADFGPHEIKTFRIGTSVTEVNLLECSK
jgi:alpha-mannosidase